MGGRLVGEHQRRVEGEGTGDRDPLLLASAQVAGLVSEPLAESDASLEQVDRAVCLARRG